MLEKDWAHASDPIRIGFAGKVIAQVLKPGGPVIPQALRLYLGLAEPLEVAEGDTVDASVVMRPSENLIAWTVTHPASGRTFRQSTWEASLLNAEDVRRVRPDHVPRLSGRGKARQIVLGYCNGRRTVREVEAAVLRDHPDLMPSLQAISDFVAEVLGRDTE